MAPELQLPPQPILIRWGTWINAATYYADNFENVQEIIASLDTEDAVFIQDEKNAMAKKGVQESLTLSGTGFWWQEMAYMHRIFFKCFL